MAYESDLAGTGSLQGGGASAKIYWSQGWLTPNSDSSLHVYAAVDEQSRPRLVDRSRPGTHGCSLSAPPIALAAQLLDVEGLICWQLPVRLASIAFAHFHVDSVHRRWFCCPVFFSFSRSPFYWVISIKFSVLWVLRHACAPYIVAYLPHPFRMFFVQ